MMKRITEYGNDVYRLFFPRTCAACQLPLGKGEVHLCLDCRMHLPVTRFETWPGNPAERAFYGRVPLVCASAFLFYSRAGSVQQILHHIKYNNRQELAVYMGHLFAGQLHACSRLKDAHFVVPVPLHPRKKALRGYNQSERFASGIAEKLGLKLLPNALERTVNTTTQTRKSRIERWENVEAVFRVRDPEPIRNRHILLVDDVLTTGATLEACARALLDAASCRVSVTALAYADRG